MRKYSLVAINCDNSCVRREQEIKLDGVDLSHLFTIDNFTSGMSLSNLWNLIWDSYDLKGFNRLAVKLVMKKGGRPIYYDVIVNNEIINCCSSTVDRKYFDSGKSRYAYVIRRDNPWFQDEYTRLMNFVDSYDIPKYRDDYFYNNKELYKLIWRYISSFYDIYEESDRDGLRSLIEDEFSKYVTFRKWIVNLERIYSKGPDKVNCEYTNQELADMYNRRYLDEDKEEFIEPEEVGQMGLVDDGYFGNKRRIKKI